jgi:DNA polymerase III epsilon subunit-like protein
MSVGGFNVGSVINPGVVAQVPSECDGAPPAREDLAPGALNEDAPNGHALDGRALDRHELNGHAPGRLAVDGHAPGGLALNGHVLGRLELGALGEMDLGCLEFAVVDLETTGWSPGAASITEIAAVRVTGGGQAAGDGRGRAGELVRRGEFASLVNPGVPVPPGIADLTGITDWMLAAAPRLGAVLPGLLGFARGCVLVAHNAPFDLGFLVAGCADCGLTWPGFTVLDTVMLARRVMDPDEVPDCKLGTLAGFFGARTTPTHRALADARATADVLGWLIRRLAHRGIRTLNQLSAWPDVVA